MGQHELRTMKAKDDHGQMCKMRHFWYQRESYRMGKIIGKHYSWSVQDHYL